MQTNKKRLLQNLILLFIVSGLIYFIATRDNENTDRGELYQTLYDDSIGDEVSQITIHAKGQDDIILQNKDEVWMLIKPIESKADTQKVQQLFTLLSENAESNYDIKGKDLSSYGLDKDNLSIKFNQVKLIFGNYNDITQQRYILKGDKMFLISETISASMKSGAEAFKATVKK